MATRKTTSRKAAQKSKTQAQHANRRLVIFLLSLVLLFFAATRLGVFGVTLYNLIRLVVGSTAYLAMALYLAYWLVPMLKRGFWSENRRVIPGVLTIYFGVLMLIQGPFAQKFGNDNALWNVLDDMGKFHVTKFAGAGFIGWFFYIPFKTLFSPIGVIVVGVVAVVAGLFIATPSLIGLLRERASKANDARADRAAQKKAAREALVQEAAPEMEPIETSESTQIGGFDSLLPEASLAMGTSEEPAWNFDNYQPEVEASHGIGLITDEGADWNDVYQPAPDFSDEEPEGFDSDEVTELAEEEVEPRWPMDDDLEEETYPEEELVEAEERDASHLEETVEGHYQLPSSQLLTPIPAADQSEEYALVEKNSGVLEEALASFKISAKVVASTVGPSVTKYELQLATGTRVNRILNLSDDLALALAAKDVRIEAPIPGKSLVGVEIPNSKIATVGFRDMWEHAATDPEKLLEAPLGKALDGSVRVFDLAKMPHLLVAGATGSGKSVAVNGIITSILMKARPDQVKFLMVDPKMVELSVYNDIPHLLIPVVTNPRKAARALQKVVDEMESRYEQFARYGVRNIAGYNEKIARENAETEVETPLMPLIVVIVDELADLMMVASKEVEDAIIRIGQKARAAGIHMILATQRPSVDVISGLIKANVPSRVAFAVSSGTDSRTILDQNGAEKLLGRGDMLFSPIDENHPVRLQGAFISDEDVEHVVSFIKAQGTAEYDEAFDPGEAEGDDNRSGYAGTAGGDSGDPLFEQAKAQVITTQKASTAALQRSLKIGFNRATDLMNELEAAGVVGPAKGTTPRKVLMNLSGDFSGEDE
ncbi:MAG: DNA translocase FtsK [Streptococcaceae bacterium]|jgi:S-DNA-T family DNA segregation ATPase FtsK/SpoIIIE|nr:DNA translocase FtsK [Streptococcaceae bacterium]